ncbi:3-methyl-2-oxobutanoate hydroxymethyltransferase, partial [Mycobacterium sp. ITM-2017-0098]
YEAGPQQALATATRMLKETGAHAVKLEGGERVADQIATISAAALDAEAAEQTIHDAIAVQEAGAFAVVMEMVPAELATQITGKLTIPTV